VQLPEKYQEKFDVWSEDPSSGVTSSGEGVGVGKIA
jgi:predicted methyltransferase